MIVNPCFATQLHIFFGQKDISFTISSHRPLSLSFSKDTSHIWCLCPDCWREEEELEEDNLWAKSNIRISMKPNSFRSKANICICSRPKKIQVEKRGVKICNMLRTSYMFAPNGTLDGRHEMGHFSCNMSLVAAIRSTPPHDTALCPRSRGRRHIRRAVELHTVLF